MEVMPIDQRDFSKVNFTPEQLYECYVVKQMTQRDIARHFHVDVRKVRYAMQEWDIAVASSGDRLNRYREIYKKMGKPFEGKGGETREKRVFSLDRYPFTEQDLRDCLSKQMPLTEIAKKFNISISRTRYAIQMLELPAAYHDYRRKLTPGKPINHLQWHYDNYLKSALLRKLTFDLSIEVFESLVTQPCYYCGEPPSQKWGVAYFSGLDRLNSDLGYIESNVKPCCRTCNFAKRKMSDQEFIAWVLRTADHIRATGLDGKDSQQVGQVTTIRYNGQGVAVCREEILL